MQRPKADIEECVRAHRIAGREIYGQFGARIESAHILRKHPRRFTGTDYDGEPIRIYAR